MLQTSLTMKLHKDTKYLFEIRFNKLHKNTKCFYGFLFNNLTIGANRHYMRKSYVNPQSFHIRQKAFSLI